MNKIDITSDKLKEFTSTIIEIDPRVDRRKLHKADSIVFLSLAAIICGAQTWNAIEDFGNAKEAFFKRHLPDWNGVPSHDTISRFFAAIDTKKSEALFREWVRGIIPHCHGVIAFDGKTIRGIYESEDDKVNRKAGRKECINNSKLQIVSAYSTAYGVFLGQIKVDEKSNEISAVPLFIDAIFMPGCFLQQRLWVVKEK